MMRRANLRRAPSGRYDRAMRRVLALVLFLAAAPLARADAPKSAPHDTGDYGGVVPGQTHKDEGKAKHRHHTPKKGELSWIGFQARDGASQVFLQSVAPFDVTQHVEHGTLIVRLAGLDRLGQNTWRPIDTRYFDTPLERIVARKIGGSHAHGRGIELQITFKHPSDAAQAQLRSATEADGYYYSYLTFGGANDTQPAADPEK